MTGLQDYSPSTKSTNTKLLTSTSFLKSTSNLQINANLYYTPNEFLTVECWEQIDDFQTNFL